MYGANLKNMDVDALLELRGEVDRGLIEQERDLKRQLGEGRKRSGRRAARAGRVSSLRGVKVPPKYRGPAACYCRGSLFPYPFEFGLCQF